MFRTFLIVVLSFQLGYGQLAPDFTVTDTDGTVHELYADHLDQGKTVVIELFFVNCPPCRAIAPNVESLYQEWGGGNEDVEIIKLSTQGGDSNADVAGFKADFGTTFPGVGADGGAAAARLPYQNGTFGPFFGTPQFSVVAPDGSVNHRVSFSALDAAIAATGATGGNVVVPDPFTTYELKYSTKSATNPEAVEFIISSANGGLSYNITQLTNETNIFNYPSDLVPEVDSPIISAVATGPALNNSVKPSDLLTTVKHILELTVLDDPIKLIAGDVNSDGDIDGKDLLVTQKVLLEINENFSSNTPSWKTYNDNQALIPSEGNTITLDFEVIKIGDVSF